MRILMLGWEFPPFIAGGLGVACFGLTRALDRRGHSVMFILPKPVGNAVTSHVTMLAPDGNSTANAAGDGGDFSRTEFVGVSASFHSPYPSFDAFSTQTTTTVRTETGKAPTAPAPVLPVQPGPAPAAAAPGMHIGGGGGAGPGYGSDLLGDSERYARLVVSLAAAEQFDAIHAHDWLTYPAGLAIARVSRKPLVVHVHSTEFDRSGDNVNQRVDEIERAGMHGADRVVAVSQLTRSICVRRYGVHPDKVDVVYNGIDRESDQPAMGAAIEAKDKIVLFLGRITMQKGPEYFIAAAKRVLEKVPDVKFVVAGAGDMALRMIELAASMGIGHKVLFTGFLRGKDVERVYRMADCYVMPSVSEPFGLAALEAIQHDVPVIVSKTSGVAEVLTHALKVDFWDIDEMANKIVAVLRHPPLGNTLKQHGAFELRRLTWDGAAEKCERIYTELAAAQGAGAS